MREYKNGAMDNARWAGFEPRDGDVFVCTPSKCGTTWMQTIVANLIWQDGKFPGPLFAICPWIEATFFMPVDQMHAMLGAQTHRRAMKSHTPAWGIPWFDDSKYICVARDGRDAFMSWCNHTERMKITLPGERFSGDYRSFYKHWLGENNFFDVVASYWKVRDRPNLLLSHYNDMKADLDGEMRRVATFLGIDVAESQWPEIVRRCTFEAMQASDKAIADFEQIFEGGTKGFIFKGTNGRWRDVLTKDDLAAYDALLSTFVPPEAARWIEGGRHAIGMR